MPHGNGWVMTNKSSVGLNEWSWVAEIVSTVTASPPPPSKLYVPPALANWLSFEIDVCWNWRGRMRCLFSKEWWRKISLGGGTLRRLSQLIPRTKTRIPLNKRNLTIWLAPMRRSLHPPNHHRTHPPSSPCFCHRKYEFCVVLMLHVLVIRDVSCTMWWWVEWAMCWWWSAMSW